MNNDKNNIVLIGFMGSGKSTIGKEVAKNMNYHFIDSDDYIEKKANKSIEDIFRDEGENVFRQIETLVVKEISNMENCVIATGGGIIKNKENMLYLKKTGVIVFLNAEPEHIYNNVKEDTSRPLLKTKDVFNTIIKLLSERKDLYKKYADVEIDVNGRSIDEIVKEIRGKFNE